MFLERLREIDRGLAQARGEDRRRDAVARVVRSRDGFVAMFDLAGRRFYSPTKTVAVGDGA